MWPGLVDIFIDKETGLKFYSPEFNIFLVFVIFLLYIYFE